MERHNFFTQTQGERTIQQYMTSLKNLSYTCEFGALRDDLIKSIFICGLNSRHNDIKEKLLSSQDITLVKAHEIAVLIESSKNHVEHLEGEHVFAGKFDTHDFNRKTSSRQIKGPVWGRLGNSYERAGSHNNSWSHSYGSCNTVKPAETRSRTGNSKELHNTGSKCSNCGMVQETKCPALGVICHSCKKRKSLC